MRFDAMTFDGFNTVDNSNSTTVFHGFDEENMSIGGVKLILMMFEVSKILIVFWRHILIVRTRALFARAKPLKTVLFILLYSPDI